VAYVLLRWSPVDTGEPTLSSELRQRIAESFHRQHAEVTGRLLASIAHDVRSAAASIIYSADFLDSRGDSVREDLLRETARDIGAASRRLQLTVDSLLDYARLGPSISVPVSLREVLGRAQGLLRSFYRDGAHSLRVEIAIGAEWVRGNPVVVEQIFVNLLLSAAECADAATLVTVSSHSDFSASQNSPGVVEVRVRADGAQLAPNPANPRPADGSGGEPLGLRIALADAQAAAATQGGHLVVQHGQGGLSFVIRLPRSEGPR
jgi:two-component system, OmpR family, sensor histidine kinase KdpD